MPYRDWVGAIALLSFIVCAPSAIATPTIDRVELGAPFQSDWYTPGFGLEIPGEFYRYTLSDGTRFLSGAGRFRVGVATPSEVVVVDGVLRATFDVQGQTLVDMSDFGENDNATVARLVGAEPLVFEAALGSSTGTLRGSLLLAENEPHPTLAPQPPRFKYLSADVGELVPFETTYTLRDGARFAAGTFSSDFRYGIAGVMDFTAATPVPEPSLALAAVVLVVGLRRRR